MVTISNFVSNKRTFKFENIMSVIVSEGIHYKSTSEVTSSAILSVSDKGIHNHREGANLEVNLSLGIR